MPYLLILCLVALFFGCAKEEEQTAPPPATGETAYGRSQAVTEYLVKINPFIKAISQVQMEIDKEAVGSSGKATGPNLAGAMKKAQPQLQALYDEFNRLEPPPMLTGMHQDIKKLMELRLEAYALTIKGQAREEAANDLSLYDAAQAKLQEANQQILALNAQMQKVNNSLIELAQTQADATP